MLAANNATNSDKYPFFTASNFMTFSTGFFLTIARTFEPLFRYIIVVKIYQFFGEFYKIDAGTSEE